MKRIALALALILVPVGASAQFMNTYLRPVSPTQIQGLGATATSITGPISTRAARIVCSISCNYSVRISGNTVPATVATGAFLPPLWVDIVSVPFPGATISLISNSGGGAVGTVWVTDMGP